MKLVSVAIVGALLLVSLFVPLSSQVSAAEENGTVAVLFDFGNGRVEWADVPITSSTDSFNATEQAAAALGLEMTAQNWGSESSPNMFIDTIEGIGFDSVTWEYWSFWTWNSTKSSWEMAMVGPSQVKAAEVGGIAIFYTAGYYPPQATPEHRYPWTSFRHDNMNTGSQLATAPNNVSLLWDLDLANGAIDAPVIGANGKIYVITGGIMNWTTWGYDTNSTIYCLDESGVVWSADIGTGYQVAAPLLYEDKVIVPSADGKVYAFDAEDGTPEWTFNTFSGSTIGVTSSPVVYQSQIIFADGNGKMFSLNIDGDQIWNMTIASKVYSSSPATKAGMVYIGSDDGKLHAIAANGTEEKWNLTIGGKVRGSPILMDDQIVVSYVNYTGNSPVGGGLAAVDYSGQLLWQTSTGVSPASASLTSQGFALMTADGMSMIGFDGSKLWNISLGTAFAGAAPTAVDGTIFAVTNEAESRVVAVSDSGSLYWEQKLLPAQYALCAPTVIDDILYVTADNGYVYAFQLSSVAPTANFTSSATGFGVSFSATISGDSLYHYSWDFGDGNASTGRNVSHTYAKAGTYDVVLTVTNPAGDSVNVTKSVTLAASNTTSEIPMWAWIAIVIAIVAIAGLALFMLRRKK